MSKHVSGPDTGLCCSTSAIDSLAALLRLSSGYQSDGITEALIRRELPTALIFANNEGHVTRDLNRDSIVGHVMMRFTVYQEEAAKLDGVEAGHEPWLSDKRGTIFGDNGYWHSYRQLLETRIPDKPLNRLDEITNSILDRLEDPTRPGQWDRRGLVMGHVQSGKTNNYVGLICKAADAGYKLIIVLAGMHNNLRAQTQFRVDEGFTGRDTRNGMRSTKRIGVGQASTSGTVISLTSASDSGDFNASAADAFGYDFGDLNNPTVFVIKKNAAILRNLYDWIQANAPKPHGHERIADIPLLVIDDEADNASVNTVDQAADPEAEPATINRLIRRLLNSFDQSAFVGYTATPFANILINNEAAHPEYGEDLFPRSFILSLNPPGNYVGPDTVFGTGRAGSNEDHSALPFVSDVTDAGNWIPGIHKKTLIIEPDLFPESLKRAIQSFVLSSAARRARGQAHDHHSMLIHVTTFVDTQKQVRDQVSDYLHRLRHNLRFASAGSNSDLRRMEEVWTEDFLQLAAALPRSTPDTPPPLAFDDLRREIVAAAEKIDVRMINGASSDVLDYHNYRDGLSAIVIGGAKLSRGLTLEGLSISYYLRASRMYDTLMQMGRWFGYRPGYLDLCRVYTTPAIAHSYRSIARATQELLAEFDNMQAEQATPADFGLRVRHSPGLMVTSAAKMRDGTKQRVSFGRRRPEVTTFPTDLANRAACINHLGTFLDGLGHPRTSVDGPSDFHWKGVPPQKVLAYLRDLQRDRLYSESRSAQPRYIADYIELRNKAGRLGDWTILLKSIASSSSRFDISGLNVGLATRSPQESTSLRYSIKSLIGSQDEAFDLTAEELRKAEAFREADESREARGATKTPHGPDFRKARSEDHGLMIFYLLSSDNLGDDIDPGQPFAAYCVSFPSDPSGASVEYIVNNVYEKQERS